MKLPTLAPGVEVKNEGCHISVAPTCLHGLDRKNFTFFIFTSNISLYLDNTTTVGVVTLIYGMVLFTVNGQGFSYFCVVGIVSAV